jgi:AcrR family transcriptional regulator
MTQQAVMHRQPAPAVADRADPARRRGAKASRAPLVREQLLVAAASLIRSGDLAALTPQALCDAARVRPNTLYAHFASADDVRHALGTRALTELIELSRTAMGALAGHDALEAFVGAQRLYAQVYPGLYAAAISIRPTQSEEAARGLVAYAQLEAEAFRTYLLPSQKVERLKWCLRAAIRGAIALEAIDAADAHDVDRKFDSLVDMLHTQARAASAWPQR